MNMSKKKQKQLPDAVTCVVVSMNDEIHIDDFLRLTGKCLGDNGTYRIEESGVTGEVGDISEVVGLTSEDQAVLLEFKRKAKLDFPCTPQRLIEWVKDTDGEFTLPDDFVLQIEEAKASAEAVDELAKSAKEKAVPDDDQGNNEDAPQETQRRRNRLYQEVELIPDWATLTESRIATVLGDKAGKGICCVKSVTSNGISWIDGNGGKQETSRKSFGKWLSRNRDSKTPRV